MEKTTSVEQLIKVSGKNLQDFITNLRAKEKEGYISIAGVYRKGTDYVCIMTPNYHLKYEESKFIK